MNGRVTVVQERQLGSTLSADAHSVGVLGVLGTGGAGGLDHITITLADDAAGDSLIIAGGNTAGYEPSGITDTKGNTYPTGLGGGGTDNEFTFGLDGTAWVRHCIYDAAPLEAGDSITIQYAVPHQAAAVVLDVQGLTGVDNPTAGGGFAFGGTFDPTGGGADPAFDNEIYVAVAYGQSQQAVMVSGLTHRDDAIDGFGGMDCSADLLGAAGPKPVVAAAAGGSHWGQGASYGYTTGGSTDTVFVEDASEFDETGRCLISGDVYTYTVVDEDTGELLLDPPLLGSVLEGTDVTLYPAAYERIAFVVQGDNPEDEEGMIARVPHALYDKIPVGIRDIDAGEGETVQTEFILDEMVVKDITGQRPVVDSTFIDPTTDAPAWPLLGDVIGTISANTIKSNVALSGNVTAATLAATGLTGATSASRYVGATTSGAPVSGTFVIGDFVIDRSGAIWICTTAGSPGTWTNAGGTPGTGTVTSAMILNGTILDEDINASAAIAYTKLALTGSILNADVASGAGIVYSKLALTGSIVNADLASHTITAASIAAGTITGTEITSSVALAGSPTAVVKFTAPALVASGLTGATAASRYVGATASGAPVSGTFAVGDFIIDQTGSVWVCTVAGTPGTWAAPTGGAASDGSPPASSPAPTVSGGLGLLVARWTATINADPVAYEVHISTSSGFTADATTLYGKFFTTVAMIRSLADGSALTYGTTYYVKLIAFDDDGSAASGTQGSGSMVQVDTADIASLAVTTAKIAALAVGTGQIAALAVTAAKIAANTITASQIAGGTITNTEINASAAIAYSKLALTGAILNADLAGSIAYSKLVLTGAILNADLAGSIAASKISGTAITAADTGTVTSTMVLDGTLLNADINAAAAIAATKISGTAAVLNAANVFAAGGSLASLGTGLTAAWKIGVDGTFLLPRVTVAQRLGSPVKGQLEWNEDAASLEVYNGSVYLPLAMGDDAAVYRGLRDLGATATPVGYTMDPAQFDGTVGASGTPNVTLTQSRLVGGAFMVNKATTVTSIRVRVLVAGAGTTGYNGMGLFSMNTSGDWTFLGDTGGNDGTIFNLTATQARNFRNAADNADLGIAVVPGVVYFAALCCGLSGVVVSGAANSLLNGGEGIYFRCGGRNTLTTRATAMTTQLTANLTQFANAPMIVVS